VCCELHEPPVNQATAMPSTSTFQAGLLRPPMISVPAARCVPNTAARPARTLATAARSIVVIFTRFSISIPAARSCACIFCHASALRLGIFRDAAVGSNADLPANVERAADAGHFHRLGILPAGAGASAALMSRRCMMRPSRNSTTFLHPHRSAGI
jgi:hypothetical protein